MIWRGCIGILRILEVVARIRSRVLSPRHSPGLVKVASNAYWIPISPPRWYSGDAGSLSPRRDVNILFLVTSGWRFASCLYVGSTHYDTLRKALLTLCIDFLNCLQTELLASRSAVPSGLLLVCLAVWDADQACVRGVVAVKRR